MDIDRYAAILAYTGEIAVEDAVDEDCESLYRVMNKALREENAKLVKNFFWRYLRLLFDAVSLLRPQKQKVFRGIGCDLSAQMKPGSEITWMCVSSTTTEYDVAEGFSMSCGGGSTMLTINAKNAINISDLSFFSNEREWLLMPGTVLKIKSAKKKGDVLYVEADELANCVIGK